MPLRPTIVTGTPHDLYFLRRGPSVLAAGSVPPAASRSPGHLRATLHLQPGAWCDASDAQALARQLKNPPSMRRGTGNGNSNTFLHRLHGQPIRRLVGRPFCTLPTSWRTHQQDWQPSSSQEERAVTGSYAAS